MSSPGLRLLWTPLAAEFGRQWLGPDPPFIRCCEKCLRKASVNSRRGRKWQLFFLIFPGALRATELSRRDIPPQISALCATSHKVAHPTWDQGLCRDSGLRGLKQVCHSAHRAFSPPRRDQSFRWKQRKLRPQGMETSPLVAEQPASSEIQRTGRMETSTRAPDQTSCVNPPSQAEPGHLEA